MIGDTYDVLVPDGTESFVLSGTATFGSTNSLAGARLTMFDLDTAQRLFDREGLFDAIDIKLEPGADADAVQAAVAEGLPADAEVVTGAAVAQEGSDQIGELASIFGNILLGFAGVALFVSAFYIYNTFSIILGQRIRELALLRAIGATAAQIRATVILEALLVGIVSSIVGIGMGMLTALGLRGILNAGGFGLPADALVLKPPTVAVAFVIGVGVTLAASILPARKASSVPPVAALRADLATSESSRRLRLLIGAIIGGIGVAPGRFRTLHRRRHPTHVDRARGRRHHGLPRHRQPVAAGRRPGGPPARRPDRQGVQDAGTAGTGELGPQPRIARRRRPRPSWSGWHW